MYTKLLSPEMFTQVAFPGQGLEKQGSVTFPQSLSKLMAVSEQGQLSFAKPWHVDLFWQDLERHLVSFFFVCLFVCKGNLQGNKKC